MTARTCLLLCLLSLCCFALYGCTTAGATETIAATGATVGAIVAAVKPLLSPEAAAKMELVAHNIDGTVQATATAVGTLVDVITQVKANATAQLADAHAQITAQAQALAALPSKTDVALISGGVSTGTAGVHGTIRNITRAKALAAAPVRVPAEGRVMTSHPGPAV